MACSIRKWAIFGPYLGPSFGLKSPHYGPKSLLFRPTSTKEDLYMVDIQTIDGTYQLWLLCGHYVVSILSVSGLYH